MYNSAKTSKRILLTGWNGYLGKKVVKQLTLPKYKLILFKGDVRCIDDFRRYNNINIVIHMAAPANDFDRFTDNYISSSIIKGTDNSIQFSNEQNAKLIFFSTMGIYVKSNTYEKSKYLATINVLKNSMYHTILMIPRLYSSDRSNGLIGKLKRGEVPEEDMLKEVEYMPTEKFIYHMDEYIKSDKKMLYFFDDLCRSNIGPLIDKFNIKFDHKR